MKDMRILAPVLIAVVAIATWAIISDLREIAVMASRIYGW